jgi:hypothetical protein
VFELHIQNRGHPMDWYTPVVISNPPEVDIYHFSQQYFEVTPSAVYQKFRILQKSVDQILFEMRDGIEYNTPQDEEGNSAEPRDMVISDVPQQTLVVIQRLVRETVQKRLDAFANTRQYDSIVSACSYATSTNSAFASEGQRAVVLRDQSWASLYTYLEKVTAGMVALPRTEADILQDQPELTW